jgi:hypothetical protein
MAAQWASAAIVQRDRERSATVKEGSSYGIQDDCRAPGSSQDRYDDSSQGGCHDGSQSRYGDDRQRRYHACPQGAC